MISISTNKQELDVFVIHKGEPLIGTWKISQKIEIEHRSLKELINDFKEDLVFVGKRPIEIARLSPVLNRHNSIEKKAKGRPVEEYLLNEPQFYYLMTLCRNTEKTRIFKMMISSGFYELKKNLQEIQSNHKNAEWLEKRASGKIERRIETDTIKQFVEYAKAQGSCNAENYYMVISKMENNTLFALDFIGQKFPNLRDTLDGFALDALKMADHIVAKALKDGMNECLHYKEIYKLAKHNVEMFSNVMGKMPLRSLDSSMPKLVLAN